MASSGVSGPPFPCTIDPAARLATVRLSGSVRGPDIAAAYAAIYRDPAFGPRFDLLWDGTAVTELLFDLDDLPSFVRLHSEFGEVASSGRDIILVTRPMDKMMADMYAAMMKKQNREVHVCTSRQEVERLRQAR